MKLRLCGVRGSTPAPGVAFSGVGGNTSCVAVTPIGGSVPTLLLDAGTGIRSVSDLVAPAPFHGTILLSHLHWDHLHGLPFFAAADRCGSSVQLLIPAPVGAPMPPVQVISRAMSPPHFPIGPEGLQGDWRFGAIDEGMHRLEGVDVLAREIPHKGGRTFGYQLADADGTVAYLPDHLPSAAGAGRAAALALAAGVDILIHDAQFLKTEDAQATAYGHSTIEQAVQLALDAGVGQLVLFHHAPGRTDEQLRDIVDRLDVGGLTVHLGCEGDVLSPGAARPLRDER